MESFSPTQIHQSRYRYHSYYQSFLSTRACSPSSIPPPPPPSTLSVQGRSLVPPNTIAAPVVMGNDISSDNTTRENHINYQHHPEGFAIEGNSSQEHYQERSMSREGLNHSAVSRVNRQHQQQQQRPVSNLTVLLRQQQEQQEQERERTTTTLSSAGPHRPTSGNTNESRTDEADTASGPPQPAPAPTTIKSTTFLGSSAPVQLIHYREQGCTANAGGHTGSPSTCNNFCGSKLFHKTDDRQSVGSSAPVAASSRTGGGEGAASGALILPPSIQAEPPPKTLRERDLVRRCVSSKELGTSAPPPSSPYAYMLYKKEALELSMRERLKEKRLSCPGSQFVVHHLGSMSLNDPSDGSSSTSSRRKQEGANEVRNRRRAEHNEAVVKDLCDVVADLFIAESKLLKPLQYGVADQQPSSSSPSTSPGSSSDSNSLQRDQIVESVRSFVSALPMRYALGADTPSEVLLHMRLMSVVRSDRTKAAVHIHNLDEEGSGGDGMGSTRTVATRNHTRKRSLRLVTISSGDAVGLLEYMSKMLATGGSRVLDADVMLSTDGIVLDRFVVEMNGRLRLDKLSNLIESFLKDAAARTESKQEDANHQAQADSTSDIPSCPGLPSPHSDAAGPLYVPHRASDTGTSRNIQAEMESAIPLAEVLASTSTGNLSDLFGPDLPKIRKITSMPETSTSSSSTGANAAVPVVGVPKVEVTKGVEYGDNYKDIPRSVEPNQGTRAVSEERLSSGAELPCDDEAIDRRSSNSLRKRRPLVNRRATSNLDAVDVESGDERSVDYVAIPNYDGSAVLSGENRSIPLVPFDELMLIEAIGTGRVSTIYRAAWQRQGGRTVSDANLSRVHMVALKVAMVNSVTGDTMHVDELRREADIAGRLIHPNVVDLVGVAADPDCFCLAYDFCEGGSLLSLLLDASRYYEYLPIALDIANGMAYLHSRNVIHRDLKPSNILLTRDHRAKIADFGMSVANAGQELTAETGTYRYMAPEVIRHESYSSNADVYSFGICLWQLITREIPFATMTPIQAAYAVAEGRRPVIPPSTPRRLQEIITACWDQDSYRRPSFTYIAMALADYAKMAFSPANVGALTLQIANEMLANVEGNSTVNVDFTAPVASASLSLPYLGDDPSPRGQLSNNDSVCSNVGLEIE